MSRLLFRAYSPKFDMMSEPFGLGDVMRGTLIVTRQKPFNLSQCEVMRQTGLVDIDKNPIWEGDIVTMPLYYKKDTDNNDFANPVDSWTDVVVFSAGRFRIRNTEFSNAFISQDEVSKSGVSVIGNRYEHPNLLQEIKV